MQYKHLNNYASTFLKKKFEQIKILLFWVKWIKFEVLIMAILNNKFYFGNIKIYTQSIFNLTNLKKNF